MQAVMTATGLGHGDAAPLPFNPTFQRTDIDAALLSDAAAFERILAEEFRHAGETSSFALTAPDLAGPADRNDLVPALSTPPWEPVQTGAVGILDGGLSLQNGAIFSRAGEGYIAPNQLDAPTSAERSDAIAPTDHWRIDLDAGGVDLLKADIYDRWSQPLDMSDGTPSPWSDGIGFSATDAGIAPSFTNQRVPDSVWMDRVFFNGDGRPILPPSYRDDHVAAHGDVMILPDGAVLVFDPWTAGIDAAAAAADDPIMGDGLRDFGGTVIIEGEFA